MANIIPMAGLGSRFIKEGYLLPKPLIPISGRPMILNVIDCLPPSDKWIFIVRKEHVEEYGLEKLIKSKIKKAIIIPVEKTTEGQASSCMLAMPYLSDNDPILIAACDNGFLYNKKKFQKLINMKDVDAIVWTFTQNNLLNRPGAWGWAKLEEDNLTIKDMSVKVPVSENPFNDHAVVATFFFKKAKLFKEAYDLMVKENYRINNEFYVDSIPVFYNRLGLKCVIFDVDLYVGWGKPEDVRLYEKKEYFCKYWESGLRLNREELKWKNFFLK